MSPVIRPAEVADAAALLLIYGPIVRSSHISFETAVPSLDEMQRRVEATIAAGLPWLAAEVSGEVAGYAYAAPLKDRPAYNWAVETSVYISPAHARVGLGRALLRATIERLLAGETVHVFAAIALPNEPSIRLFESEGFERVGTWNRVGFKHGAWHDVGWWQRALRDLPMEPREPT